MLAKERFQGLLVIVTEILVRRDFKGFLSLLPNNSIIKDQLDSHHLPCNLVQLIRHYD